MCKKIDFENIKIGEKIILYLKKDIPSPISGIVANNINKSININTIDYENSENIDYKYDQIDYYIIENK